MCIFIKEWNIKPRNEKVFTLREMFSDNLVESYFQQLPLPFPEIIDTIASLKKNKSHISNRIVNLSTWKYCLFFFKFILFPHATGTGIFFESFLPRIIFCKLLYFMPLLFLIVGAYDNILFNMSKQEAYFISFVIYPTSV